jgi:hypothetical protein
MLYTTALALAPRGVLQNSQPFSAYHEGFDGTLAPIVVELQSPVQQKTFEFAPLASAILDSVTERALG